MERFSVLVPTIISMIDQLFAGGGIRSYLRSGQTRVKHKECRLGTGQNYRGFQANQRGLGQIPGKYCGELKKRPPHEWREE